MKERTFDPKSTSKCKKIYFDIPEDWACIKAEGFGFITRALFRNPQGRPVIWESRHHRKHHFKLDITMGTTLWAPGAIGWWIGILFGVGSVCFALGSVPGYLTTVGNSVDGLTFFVGSLFFTSAAYLQYLETANTPHPLKMNYTGNTRYFRWESKGIGWWATAVQFVGTLFFNISTLNSMGNLSTSQINHMAWTPDALGSVCFLVASGLAWIEVSHALWSWKPDKYSWWIGGLNLLGSIFFGVSAVGAIVLPATGLPSNIFLVNLGTFLGAVCFLIGAVTLLPERTHEEISDYGN